MTYLPQVQFFQGTAAQVQTTPLNPGAIYFVPTTKRLYIDTITDRIPVTATNGQNFYIKLLSDGWDDENQQTVNIYYTTRTSSDTISLSTLLLDETILFVGNIYKNGTQVTNYYIKCESIDLDNGALTFSYNGDAPNADLIVQCYIPNNNSDLDLKPEISYFYTTNFTLLASNWTFNEVTLDNGTDTENSKYVYVYTFPDFYLPDANAFIINCADDSLENVYMFNRLESITCESDKSAGTTTFTFTATCSNNTALNKAYNLQLNLIASLQEDQTRQDILYIDVPSDATDLPTIKSDGIAVVDTDFITGSYTFGKEQTSKDLYMMAYRPDTVLTDNETDVEKELISYYNSISSIVYNSNKTITLTFDMEALGIKSGIIPTGFQLNIVILNKLANIYEIKLSADDWNKTSNEILGLTYSGLEDQSVLYFQSITTGTNLQTGDPVDFSTTPLSGYKPQIIVSKDGPFGELIEERTLGTSKMYFYTKDTAPTKDITAIVVDLR